MKPEEIVALINNINTLYNNSFYNLVAYTVGLMLFAGAFVPAIISFFMNRQFVREQESTVKQLEAKIQELISSAKFNLAETLSTQVKNDLKQQESALTQKAEALSVQVQSDLKLQESRFTQRIDEITSKFDKKINVSEGGQFHLQGNRNLDSKNFPSAAEDFAVSAAYYFQGEDEQNLQIVLRNLHTCLPNVTKEQLEFAPNIEKFIESLIKRLKDKNPNGRYTNDIDSLSKELKLAQNRQPKIESPK